jgi:hypothetical protein
VEKWGDPIALSRGGGGNLIEQRLTEGSVRIHPGEPLLQDLWVLRRRAYAVALEAKRRCGTSDAGVQRLYSRADAAAKAYFAACEHLGVAPHTPRGPEWEEMRPR